MTTNDYIDADNHHGLPPFCNHLWQRNYHDRIIRSAANRDRIRTYIDANPVTWRHDRVNPAYVPPFR